MSQPDLNFSGIKYGTPIERFTENSRLRAEAILFDQLKSNGCILGKSPKDLLWVERPTQLSSLDDRKAYAQHTFQQQMIQMPKCHR